MASDGPTRPPSESDISTSPLRKVFDRIDDLEDDLADLEENVSGTHRGFASAIDRIDKRFDELEQRLEDLEEST